MLKPQNTAVFVISKERYSPYRFGRVAASMATQSSTDLLKSILDSAPSTELFYRMNIRPRLAQMYVMTLHITVYYVFAQAGLGVPHDVLAEIYRGFNDEMADWGLPSESIEHLDLVFRLFGESLYSELHEEIEDVGFNADYGPTTKHVFELIKTAYNEHDEFKERGALEVCSIDEVTTRMSIFIVTQVLLESLAKNVTFVP